MYYVDLFPNKDIKLNYCSQFDKAFSKNVLPPKLEHKIGRNFNT